MITGINHLTWNVTDIQQAFDFYVDVLGFKPIMKSEWSAYFLAGDVWIAITLGDKRSDTRYDHIAFNVTEAAYNQLVTKLKSIGIIEWQENTTEGDSFYFLDFSGNKFELHYSTLENRIKDGKAHWGSTVEWFL